jgi:hypothetical protein
LHPWEIDPDQPRMDGPWVSKFRHYLNLKRTEKRIQSLLRDFSFAPVVEIVQPIREMIQARAMRSAVLRTVSGCAAEVSGGVLETYNDYTNRL